MELYQAIVLGAVQGLTEFLPVSSSGHLKVLEAIMLDPQTVQSGVYTAFDVLLHLATLLAVVIYFRTDLWHMIRAAFSRSSQLASDRRLAWLVLAATIPTGLIGLLGNDWFETVDLLWVGFAFLGTSAFLVAAERFSSRSLHAAENLSWGRSLLVGVAQGIAIMPGISRSGATMSSGLGLGLDREQAARFSFLLSVPIILLAGAKKGVDVISGGIPLPPALICIAGFVVAAVTGYVAVAGLMRYIKNHSFYLFAVYTAVLGLAVIVWRVAG